MVEDSELDGLKDVAAYNVMAILSGKMLPQAGAKVMAQYAKEVAESIWKEWC